ncbi:MAG: diguanylate cyclase domain-containing protein [Betaproteobacteria bacterium]
MEDDPGDARLVATSLRQHGEGRFELTHAPTLSAALPLALKGDYDAVLLDLSLPDSAGLASVRDFALALPRVPVVVLTGLADEDAAVEAMRHGAQDYLVKGEDAGGRLAHAILMAIARKAFAAQLAERANFDELTGLVNRSLFRDRLRHALSRAGRMRDRVALLYIDLDGFKAVNDTLGHAVGDQVLQAVADRFRSSLRRSETIARIGGDEFTVLVEGLSGSGDAIKAADRVLAALGKPLNVAGREVRITPSVGVALFPDHARDAEDLMRHADTAMFWAKKAGSNCARVFSDA